MAATLSKFKAIIRTSNEDIARKRAQDDCCAYGICIVDGLYYVGLRAELKKAPIIIANCNDFAVAEGSAAL